MLSMSEPAAPKRTGHIPALDPFGKRKRQSLLCALSAVLCCVVLCGQAVALPGAPSLKPPESRSLAVLPASEMTTLSKALNAADEGRWSDARAGLSRLRDSAAKLLVQWRLAMDGGADAGFTERAAAYEQFKDWPARSEIAGAAEAAVSLSSLSPEKRIEWLLSLGPTTGEGVLALADAYRRTGREEDAGRIVRDFWRTRFMTTEASTTMLTGWGSQLSPADHWARVDMLLWRSARSNAQVLFPQLSDDRRAVATARLALAENSRNADALFQSVPADLSSDPGLLFERARWLERKGRDSEALEMLLRVRGSEAPPSARPIIWNEKQALIRPLLKSGDVDRALQLCLDHGMVSGEGFRDAEWLAGWIMLKRMRNPVEAQAHFRLLKAGVDAPISVARASYWLGEALSAQGRAPEAQAAYAEAAKLNFVFYGQLAAEKVAEADPSPTILSFPPTPLPTPAEKAEFESRPQVRAAILAADAGRTDIFERFSFYLDDNLSSASEHLMLADIAQRYLQPRAAVRGGKAGLARGFIAPEAVFPLMPLPPSTRSGSAEPALVLALSRQESEFNPRAVSPAGARGLMQLIPRYAQAEAKYVGAPFRANWLTDDPEYNLRIGRGFLDDLVDKFGGSYVLATAAYNAGPSRAREWISELGDPRGQVDPVDWIESIPISETRNYVMRVLENTQVYRQRLAGQPTKLRLLADLKRGAHS